MDERSSHSLSRARCEELLAGTKIGRVILTERALPTAISVAYALDKNDIVFRSSGDTSLAGTLKGTVVAFQVDHVDEEQGTGWSVVVTGVATPVTDPQAESRANALGIQPWIESACFRFIRLTPTIISGRLITYRP